MDNTLIPKIDTNTSYYKYFTSYIFSYDYIKPIYMEDTTEYKKYFADEYRKLKLNQLKEQLKTSPSIQRFNEKFLQKLDLSFYRNIEQDLTNNYNIDIHANLNNIIHFKVIDFVNNIYETYHSDEDIVKQFTLDFPRHKIYINNIPCTELTGLFSILSKYNRDIDISPERKTTTFMLSLLLICQSSFYMSFLHIYNKINKMKEEYLINSTNDIQDTDTIPLLNYHITDKKEQNNIHLTIDEFRFCCVFNASYQIINVSTEKTIYNISAETIFDLNFDECLIVYESV